MLQWSMSNGLVYKPHPQFLTQNFGKKVRLIHEFLRYTHKLYAHLIITVRKLEELFTSSSELPFLADLVFGLYHIVLKVAMQFFFIKTPT